MRPLIPLLLIGLFCSSSAASHVPCPENEGDGFTVRYTPPLSLLQDPFLTESSDPLPRHVPHSYVIVERTQKEDVPPGLVWASRFVNGFMLSGGVFFLSLIIRQALGI